MKTLLYKLSLITALLVQFKTEAAKNFPFEKIREKSYQYKYNGGMSMRITNSYGKISVTGWNQDSIHIVARIIARAKSNSEAEELLDYATIDEFSSPASLYFQTVFGKNYDLFERANLGIQEAIGDREVQVEYVVFAPNEMALTLENRFGDIYLSDWKGGLNLKNTYGDVRTGNINTCILTLKYGKAFMDSAERLNFGSTFGELNIPNVANLVSNSISTTFNLGKAGNVNFESKNDKIFANQIKNMTGTTFLSNVSIDNLIGNVNFKSRFGEIRLSSISPESTGITLLGGNTDFTLNFDPKATVSVDLMLKSQKYLNCSPSFKTIKDENHNKMRYMTVKKGENPKTRVVIEASSAYINLRVD